ncbi:MAG: putative hydro-lyase [Tolumonas sp.]|nr:putative hydro-lyase [Tolumonas sp.]
MLNDTSSLSDMNPQQARQMIRQGDWSKPTAGLCAGYTQANLAILPKASAFDFLLFCQRNPKPCPLLDVTDVGSPIPKMIAASADLRTDIPKYRIYRHGELADEVMSLTELWQDDWVGFLLGCSFTFEHPLLAEGIPVRHIEEGRNVPMYISSLPCLDAGSFSGTMVVSMRPMTATQAIRAVQITSRFPSVHGAPVHIGDPTAIGISDINAPDFGESVTLKSGEIPVFWACGVTPQAIAIQSKIPLMVTHAPGHMLICDVKDSAFAVF